MKKLFAAIKKNDIETVKQLLEKQPELVSCIAAAPPKSDAGQSPLQVAFKTDSLEIAEYLMDKGADVNFMESKDCGSPWRTPVLHDAINAAIMNTRWNANRPQIGLEVLGTKEKADYAYGLLERMLDLGADVNMPDSCGNTGIWRACTQAEQILPRMDRATGALSNDRLFTKELEEDLHRIFKLLLKHGADLTYVRSDVGMTVLEICDHKLLKQLLQ